MLELLRILYNVSSTKSLEDARVPALITRILSTESGDDDIVLVKAEASTLVLNLDDKEISGLELTPAVLTRVLEETTAKPDSGIPLNAVLLAAARIVQLNDTTRKNLRHKILPGKWYHQPSVLLV